MPASLSSSPRLTRPVTVLAMLGGIAVGATLLLWAHYGTAVFFEMVRAGWAACF
jgi:hypothetical protein